MALTTIGYIALAASAGSAAMSSRAAKKSSKAQRRANEAQRKVNVLKNKQAKRAFLRNFRQQQAMALQSSIAMGVGLESSAAQGQASSLASQRDTGVADLQEMTRLGGEVTTAMNQQSRYNFRAQSWGAAASFAQQFIAFEPK